MTSTPPGWPRGLVVPADDGFEEAAVRWLLDVAPGELRTSELRQHPRALAVHVVRLLEAELEATRASYAHARVDLAGDGAAVLESAQRALEAEGARLLARGREARLVQQALMDRRN